jgi:hypothetical protein
MATKRIIHWVACSSNEDLVPLSALGESWTHLRNVLLRIWLQHLLTCSPGERVENYPSFWAIRIFLTLGGRILSSAVEWLSSMNTLLTRRHLPQEFHKAHSLSLLPDSFSLLHFLVEEAHWGSLKQSHPLHGGKGNDIIIYAWGTLMRGDI